MNTKKLHGSRVCGPLCLLGWGSTFNYWVLRLQDTTNSYQRDGSCPGWCLPALLLLVLVPVGGVEQDQVLRQPGIAQAGPPAELTPQPVGLSEVHPPHVVLLAGFKTPLYSVGVREPGSSSAPPRTPFPSVPSSVHVQGTLQLRHLGYNSWCVPDVVSKEQEARTEAVFMSPRGH